MLKNFVLVIFAKLKLSVCRVENTNYPDLSVHNNWMAKCLTPEVYKKLCSKKTPAGFTLDQAIQTGKNLWNCSKLTIERNIKITTTTLKRKRER